ncbi:4-hydroxy-tetrahydrodipicolinate synthase [Paractinoplanes ferrugineus]|uniref:4-hydroxy-tetrahydrodipicolinate synthase n=1 Tax=Paractinoplanes ferrugineus TaxID=113564 RepID=A0A919MF86_9ACTN|nr:dihydrodipicolinate synthase family protein [Actinoplanes ferrugineus]GIE12484.1 4-hydroxy-tetrahydrodipicolinate synthase [Actinoplanes ferrugineus]
MLLTGLHLPMITPFDESGAVAFAALESLAHRVLGDGATGLVALGTTGEPGSLTPDERRGVVDLLAAVCHEHGAPLTVGANTADELRALAGRPAVVAALTLVPPFLRPGEDGVTAHLSALAAVSPVPLIVYHVPYRTAQPLSVRTLTRLAAVDGIAGVKLATGAIDADVVALLAAPPPGFAVLGGDDQLISPLLALGAHGAILASAHLATADFVALLTAWQQGDVTRARRSGHRLSQLSAALFAEPNPAVVKAVLHAENHIPTPAVRLPLLPAATESTAEVLRLLG